MSEEASASQEGGVDPVATSMALSGASRAKADAFLEDQRHHLYEQARHLREQLSLKLWELRMGVFLRVATLVVGLAFATGAGLMVWDAAHSKGLIIEPFAVPSSLRERGLSGEVIASQMIDKLSHMTKSESSRAVQSYANNWGQNIKVEIPETGVSIGELRQFLKDWLGHDIRISGEIYRTADGVAVTARTSGEEGATFTGKESDLDTLVQQAAEHVYEVTQPYRYANYLDRNHDPRGAEQRVAKASAIYRRLIVGDDPLERAWAWNGLGTVAAFWQHDNRLSEFYYRKALQQVPDFTIGYYALSARNGPLGQEEEELSNLRQAVRLLHRDSIPDLNPHYVPNARISADGQLPGDIGDFAASIPVMREGAALPDSFSVLARQTFYQSGMIAMSRQHDLGAVRTWMRELGWRELPPDMLGVRFWVDMERRDWGDILAIEASGRKGLLPADFNGTTAGAATFNRSRPFFALASAQTGDFAGAEALIAPTSGDNDMAVRVRALIAELGGQHVRADWWFARSERQTPSIPFTDALWGEALLKRGQPDAAIEKFKLSNRKGPHFADPLEGWGEALMAKNQSHLALEKFAKANNFAPNWARLHLKWGEALVYAGKPAEAKAEFARAAALDLSKPDKAELAGMNPHV